MKRMRVMERQMTPTLTLIIKANSALVTKEAVSEHIEQLQAEHSELAHYAGALVDVVNTKENDKIEIYDEPEEGSTNGTRLLWIPNIGRAALNAYQAGDWQWTDASSPEDALRRFRENDMAE